MSTTTQLFDTTDRLRLEIGVTPAGLLPNKVLNPRGAQGAWGWQTPAAGVAGLTTATMKGSFYPTSLVPDRLVFEVPAPGGAATFDAWAHSDPVPAAPGTWHGGSITIREAIAASREGFLAVQFMDAAGAVISVASRKTILTGTAANTVHALTPVQAPAGTAYAALRVGAWSAVTGSRRLVFDNALLCQAPTSAAVTGLDFREPVYTDVLTKTQEIKVVRGGLSLGTITATIRDADLDPATNPLLRPNNTIRLLARTYDAAGTVATGWEPLYVGFIKRAPVSYDLAHPDPVKRTRIKVTGVDASARLASTPQPASVATIGELVYLLESTGVPWIINGSGNQKPGAGVEVGRLDRASVLDQIGLTRDSRRGHAWVNRFGAVCVEEPANVSTLVRATLGEADYNADISIDYDTARIINVITVKHQSLDATGAPVEIVLGPYVDEPSRDQWGAFSEEFTVVGIAITDVPGFAAAILAASSQPTLKVNSLTLPILEDADFKADEQTGGAEVNKRAHLDLYDRVTVNNARSGLAQTLRVAELVHEITPEKWLTRLEFASTSGVAMPSPAPAVTATEAAGWTNYTPTARGNPNALTAATTSGSYALGPQRTVHFQIYCNVTNSGFAAGQNLLLGLPFTPRAGQPFIAVGRENQATGTMLQGVINGGNIEMTCLTYNNGAPVTHPRTFLFSGTYQRQ